MELERSREKLRAQGYGLAAISYDGVEVLDHFAKRRGIGFPLLSDPDSAVIKAFGVLNDKAGSNPMFAGIPHPGTFLVDASGNVTAKFFEEDYRQRYTVSGIFSRQFGEDFATAREKVDSKFVTVTASISDTSLRPGQHTVLTLEVDVKPGLHVYAPGVSDDFIPVRWDAKDTASYALKAPAFPAPVKLKVGGDPEPVPVFQGKFRVTRAIVLSAKPEPDASGDVAIANEFRYQACTDTVCYPPVTVPLAWKVHVEGHDRERVPEALRRK